MPNRQCAFSNKKGQIASEYLAINDRRIAIAYFAIKERQIAIAYLAIISAKSPKIIKQQKNIKWLAII